MSTFLHRLLHWFRLEPCEADTQWRNGVLWHIVRCRVCHRIVNQWESNIHTADLWGRH